MSVFASRSLAESIVDSSRDLFSPGRRDYSRHSFPTSSIANANSVSPLSIASWPRSCSVAKTSCHPSSHVISPALPDIHDGKVDSVPLVSQTTVVQAPGVTPQATIEGIQPTVGILEHLRPRRTVIRRNWQRFLAVHVSPAPSASHGRPFACSWHRRARPLLQLACHLPAAPACPFATWILTPTASSCVPTRSTTQENSSIWGRMNRARAVSSDAPVSVFPRYNQRERRYVNFDSIAFGGSSWNR